MLFARSVGWRFALELFHDLRDGGMSDFVRVGVELVRIGVATLSRKQAVEEQPQRHSELAGVPGGLWTKVVGKELIIKL